MTKGKKHMDGTKRCRIQFGLEAGESARTIAKEIGVSLTTVTREISKHTYESFKGCYVGRTYADYQKFLADHPGGGPVYVDVGIERLDARLVEKLRDERLAAGDAAGQRDARTPHVTSPARGRDRTSAARPPQPAA